MRRPALWANGRLVCGDNHGIAFGMLTEEEQNGDLVSGFFEDGIFHGEDMEIFMKSIFIFRHAESKHNIGESDDLDSELSERGQRQAERLLKYLDENYRLDEYMGFVSPFQRCLETARYIPCKEMIVEPAIHELSSVFPEEGIIVPGRSRSYVDYTWPPNNQWHFHREQPHEFLGRLRKFIQKLPEQSVVVSHGLPCILLTRMLLGINVNEVPEWNNDVANASLTHIENGKLVCMGRCDFHE